MVQPSGFAAFAAGVALLEREDAAVSQLVDLADGEVGGLYETRDLLESLDSEPDDRRHAIHQVERAIRRIRETRDGG